MPAKKKKSTIKKSVKKEVVEQAPIVEEKVSQQSSPWTKVAALVLGLLLIVVALGIYKKELFVAAVIDNKPIFTWELNSSLQKRFGSRILDEMIDKQIIFAEAQKEGIVVSQDEINKKIKNVETQVGGKDAMKNFLVMQGLTEEDLRTQLELKFIVDKILEKQVKVTDKDIADFLEKNKESLPATDEASLKTMAKDALSSEQSTQNFTKWYTALKAKSKIYKFY